MSDEISRADESRDALEEAARGAAIDAARRAAASPTGHLPVDYRVIR